MCGIVLVTRVGTAVPLCISLLQRLQHRGHQGTKIVYGNLENPRETNSHGGLGSVEKVFSYSDFGVKGERKYNAQWCVGHTRYTTYSDRGTSRWEDAQPFVMDTLMGRIVIAHNGQVSQESVHYTRL